MPPLNHARIYRLVVTIMLIAAALLVVTACGHGNGGY
jgi:hypothetical protein